MQQKIIDIHLAFYAFSVVIRSNAMLEISRDVAEEKKNVRKKSSASSSL